jgi:hypothetical protein
MSQPTIADLENRLEKMFARIPALPKDVKDLIVLYGPYLVLLGGILSILGSGILNIYTISLGTFINRGMTGLLLYNFYLSIIFSIVSGIALIFAFKPLQEKQIRGWRILFYLSLIFAVLSIISLSIPSLFGPLLCLYFLFQIKSYYN